MTTNAISSRFKHAQVNRTLKHPLLVQPNEKDEMIHAESFLNSTDSKDSRLDSFLCRPCAPSEEPAELIVENENRPKSEIDCHSKYHTFVVCADSQLGMTSLNKEWETELHYSRLAVEKINLLQPRPKFVCICGDLVDMENSFYYNNPNSLKDYELDECERIQKQQFEDFQKVFNGLHPDIAVVCLCGNHDIGNRPTPASIEKFRDAFGDEYLAFWVNGTYNIVLNNVLFTNPDGAEKIFIQQLDWLEERLEYANRHQAAQIFVFAHHPWFLYHDEEDHEDFAPDVGSSFPSEWNDGSGKFDGAVFPDEYFTVPKKYRKIAMDLFREYHVAACFSGHFHQNLVSKSSFGMDMIVTGPLSMVFNSKGKPNQPEANGRGFRVVEVSVNTDNRTLGNGHFVHHFESID